MSAAAAAAAPKMTTEFKTSNIDDFLDAFAGREGMEGYDDSKPIKMAECNRDFVWSLKMQKDLICSILMGFPIPAITIVNGRIVDGGNRSTTLWRFRNGCFTVTLGDREMDYAAMCRERTLSRFWDCAVLPQQVIHNASPDQVAQIYENLNKGVVLTFGQLLKNRRHRAWVAMAEAMLGRTAAAAAGGAGAAAAASVYPDRDLLGRVWAPRFKTTTTLRELGFAFQVLVGAECGPQHFHMSFVEHLPRIMGDSVVTTGRLHEILAMLDACDPDHSVSAKKKKEIFQKFIGAIVHDAHTDALWAAKWSEFLPRAYNVLDKAAMNAILNVGNLRGKSTTKIAGVSDNVTKFLAGRLAVPTTVADAAASEETDETLDSDAESEE
jgi:hypothetical protein